MFLAIIINHTALLYPSLNILREGGGKTLVADDQTCREEGHVGVLHAAIGERHGHDGYVKGTPVVWNAAHLVILDDYF